MSEMTEFYKRVVEDHVTTYQFTTLFQETVEQNDLSLLIQTLLQQSDEVLRFMSEHFTFEEQFVFPSILSAHPDGSLIDTILNLSKEHGELLLGATTMIEMAQLGETMCSETRRILFSLTQRMCTLSFEHEKRENELYDAVLLEPENRV